MKKLFLVFSILFIVFFLFSDDEITYETNKNDTKDIGLNDDDVNDTKISWIAGEETVWLDFGLHSPVNSYTPAVKFETRFILNDILRLAIVGNFFNEAVFKDIKDESTDQNFNQQRWTAIKNYLETYIGWRLNNNIHFGFMLGGGVNAGFGEDDKVLGYFKEVNNNNNHTTIQKNGYGYVKTGFGVKFNSELFNNVLNHIFIEEYFNFRFLGEGSVGVEQFSFGTGLDSWYNNNRTVPSTYYSWQSEKDNRFKYFGFKNNGTIGISIPFHKLMGVFSKFDNFEFKVELEHETAFKYYYVYEYFVSPGLRTYDIRTHFDPTGAAIMTAVILRPIPAIEIYSHYKPKFTITFTEWFTDSVEYKNYKFSIVHEIEGSTYFRFPKVVHLKIGTKYYIRQEFDYQYMNDGDKVRQLLGTDTLEHAVQHVLEPICELSFKIVERKDTDVTLKTAWKPKIYLFDAALRQYSIETTAGSYMIDTNILNLANWKLEVEIRFNPKKL